MSVRTFGLALVLSVLLVRSSFAIDPALEAFSEKLLTSMCAHEGAWMDDYKLPRAQCREISKSVLAPCIDRVFTGRTVPFEKHEDLELASQELLACMKSTFLASHGEKSAP